MCALWIDNDMVIDLSGDGKLKDRNGDPVTGATVEVTLFESDMETEVDGVTWPITLNEDENEDGEYWGILPSDVNVIAGNLYIISIVAVQGPSKGRWIRHERARYRET